MKNIQTNLLNIETNLISTKDKIESKKIQKKVPDDALYFEGIVSDGEVNRNGYAINSDAWFFDNNKYVNDFIKTGTILYNHNPEQPIGRPLSFEKCKDKIKVSGYVYDDYYTNGAIKRGLILGLSTGHITHEQVFRNKKGKCYSEEEFNNLDRTTLASERPFTVVVNKAEIVEFSFVTTRSNRASVLTNSIDTLAKNLNKSTNDVENLFLNNEPMNIEENDVLVTSDDPHPAEDPVVTEQGAEDSDNTVNKEVEEQKEEPATDTPDTPDTPEEPVETNSIDLNTLNNELAELKKDFAAYKVEAKAEIAALEQTNATLKGEIENYQKLLEADIKANAPRVVATNASTDLKSISDFKDKYSKF